MKMLANISDFDNWSFFFCIYFVLVQMKLLLFPREKILFFLFLLFYMFSIYDHLKKSLPQNEQNRFRQESGSTKVAY